MDWPTALLTIGGWVAGAVTVLVGAHFGAVREHERERRRELRSASASLLAAATDLTIELVVGVAEDQKALPRVLQATDRVVILDKTAGEAALRYQASLLEFVFPGDFSDLTEGERAERLESYQRERSRLIESLRKSAAMGQNGGKEKKVSPLTAAIIGGIAGAFVSGAIAVGVALSDPTVLGIALSTARENYGPTAALLTQELPDNPDLTAASQAIEEGNRAYDAQQFSVAADRYLEARPLLKDACDRIDTELMPDLIWRCAQMHFYVDEEVDTG